MESQNLYSRQSIRNEISLERIIETVREALIEFAKGRTQMPAKDYLLFNQHNGDLRTMSSYVPKFNLATVKLVNSHPANPETYDLPTVMALLCAFDPETGQPLAVMDGTELTKLRTAAASALATKQFTAKSVTNLGMIGTGAQARPQLRGQLWARDFQTVYLYDINEKTKNQFFEWATKTFPEVEFQRIKSADDLFTHSEVIVSLTPAREPLVESSLPQKITHINAMGADAPGKQEWPDSLLEKMKIIVDDWEQARHSGEVQRLAKSGDLAEHDLFSELGEALADNIQTPNDVTLFDSTGLAIQDTACAHAVLESSLDPDNRFSFLE